MCFRSIDVIVSASLRSFILRSQHLAAIQHPRTPTATANRHHFQVPLVTALFEAAESGDQTMHLAARVFPITHSCKANPKDVGRAAAHLLDPVFLHDGAAKVRRGLHLLTSIEHWVYAHEPSLHTIFNETWLCMTAACTPSSFSPQVTYSVQYRARNNSTVNRREIFEAINGPILAHGAGHTFDPDSPEVCEAQWLRTPSSAVCGHVGTMWRY